MAGDGLGHEQIPIEGDGHCLEKQYDQASL